MEYFKKVIGRSTAFLSVVTMVCSLQVCEEIKAASRVVLVGGGPVGVELAGEIRQAFGAEKSITVCHSGPAPCHNQQGIDTPAGMHTNR